MSANFATDADGRPLNPGSFYWALPVFDPDTDAEWINREQPARFAGYTETGEPQWTWLGLEGAGPDGVSEWPSRWIGGEIKA